MNNQRVTAGGIETSFFHPYMQVFIMFLAESVWMGVFLLNPKKYAHPLEVGKTPHSKSIFLFTAFADIAVSIVQYFGLNYVSPSTFLLFKGSSIISNAFFSKLLLNVNMDIKHWIGCTLAMIGLIIASLSGLLDPENSHKTVFLL
jgi:drug/metabolite transporter (DMT)-like permease